MSRGSGSSCVRVVVVIAVTVMAAAFEARAEPGGSDIRVLAKKQAHDGAEAYKDGRYAEALRLFERAYKTVPAPALALNLSRTELRLSDCDEALRYAQIYDALSGSETSDASSSPAAWLTQLQVECPEVEIKTEPSGASLLIEGRRSATPATAPWKGRLSAGPHSVLARSGGAVHRQTLTVVAGQPYHVLISFVEDLPLLEAPAAPASSPPAPVLVAAKEAAPPPGATKEAPPAAAPTPHVLQPTAGGPSSSQLAATSAPATGSISLFPAPAAPVNESAPATKPNTNPALRNVGYAGIAVGGAALITALALGIVVLNGSAAAGRVAGPRTIAQANAEVSGNDSQASGTQALLVIGGVLVAGGVPLAVAF